MGVMKPKLLIGDAVAVMRRMPDASVDAIVCDPPYDLTGRSGKGGFMGKAWDGTGVAFNPETWREALRVLKPGGHLLAFGGTRTWHRLAVAVEDGGFEMRDSIAWLHSQGFPKAKNVLKPAFEPIVVARKPFRGSERANIQAYGTGALNIDATRIEATDSQLAEKYASVRNAPPRENAVYGKDARPRSEGNLEPNPGGRWPANVVLDEDQAAALDAQSGTLKSGALKPYKERHENASSYSFDREKTYVKAADQGGASRFFHVAREDDFPCCSGGDAETDIDTNGLSGEPPARGGGSVDAPAGQLNSSDRFKYCAKAPKSERPVVNGVAHPTVKPLALMRWLVRLVTPPGGMVLDPFAGSGTTGEAAILEGFRVTLIEREREYVPLIMARLGRAQGSAS